MCGDEQKDPTWRTNLFSEEQVEVYRALGEHEARGFVNGRDSVAVHAPDYETLMALVNELLPGIERPVASERAPAA